MSWFLLDFYVLGSYDFLFVKKKKKIFLKYQFSYKKKENLHLLVKPHAKLLDWSLEIVHCSL